MSIGNMYSGNAYENDNVDSRADLSKLSTRNAVAVRVLRAKRPFNMDEERWEALTTWAQNQSSGIDSLPPVSVAAIVACRWPGEPEESNGIRAERNTKF